MAFLEKAVKIRITQIWCNLQRFKMNFKNIHLPIAYSGINRREIFKNSDLVGMNREDSNLVSSKNDVSAILKKMDRMWLSSKIIKIFAVFQRKHACLSPDNLSS